MALAWSAADVVGAASAKGAAAAAAAVSTTTKVRTRGGGMPSQFGVHPGHPARLVGQLGNRLRVRRVRAVTRCADGIDSSGEQRERADDDADAGHQAG